MSGVGTWRRSRKQADNHKEEEELRIGDGNMETVILPHAVAVITVRLTAEIAP